MPRYETVRFSTNPMSANTKNKSRNVGRSLLNAKLGEGASGIVYRATDPLLNRDVAIKMVRADVPQPRIDLVNKCMAKADEDRVQSADELARATERLVMQLNPDSDILSSSGKYLDD